MNYLNGSDIGYLPGITQQDRLGLTHMNHASPSGGSSHSNGLDILDSVSLAPTSSPRNTPVLHGHDDHGDNRHKATYLPVGTMAKGKIDSRSDQDWFRIEVKKKGVHTIYSSGNGDLVGALYKHGSLRPIRTDDNGAGDGKNFKMEVELEPGTYYMKVTGRKSAGANYTISTLPPRPPVKG